MSTLTTSLLQGMKDHGAREILGIPGDFVLPFFKVIEESGILPHYTLSHESGVGFAADAAARYHGGLGVAVVTFWGRSLNLVNGVADAYAERSPVVYREITCDQAVLTDASIAHN
jgi:indolepyruvate decarboxylase